MESCDRVYAERSMAVGLLRVVTWSLNIVPLPFVYGF